MIRLIGNPKKESYHSFYKVLGFFPSNIEYYEEALSHKSLSRELKGKHVHDNERLEFLGDAILSTIIADIIYRKFPDKDEGFLTNTRSKIVQRNTLNHVAIELGLDKMILTSSRINFHKNHIYGNALEAFIGAVYLDQGFEKTKKFIENKILNTYLNLENLVKKEVNFKSKLIEWSQKYKVGIKFELIEHFKDSDNNPIFQTRAILGEIPVGIGIGYSKKESQQEAAKMAIKKIRSDRDLALTIKKQSQKREEKNIENEISIDPESYLLNGINISQL